MAALLEIEQFCAKYQLQEYVQSYLEIGRKRTELWKFLKGAAVEFYSGKETGIILEIVEVAEIQITEANIRAEVEFESSLQSEIPVIEQQCNAKHLKGFGIYVYQDMLQAFGINNGRDCWNCPAPLQFQKLHCSKSVMAQQVYWTWNVITDKAWELSVSAQQSAFAVGVLSDLYAFHRSTGNSLFPYHALRPIIPDNACILCLTAAAGTELADAYSSDTVIASSPRKEVHDPWAFYLHAALLRQAFAHCGKFPTAASRRSLGRVSVPVWLIILSDQLLIIALPGVRSQQYSHPYPITSIPQASYAFSFDHGRGASQNRKTYIGFRDNQARTDDFHHVKVTLYR
ncbi:hypothetical protein ZIOFF_028416 [Zingiber officinale]|uniref:Uncharacterized protein n=1 Tax=Zingiber officinale TaxID=94328 RepID=A0A8J5GV12_ZINOF|nr:hypothetical protein ZIOFF_028416 [Zingiber officinale]